MLNSIRPVDRDFGIMVGALPLEYIEEVAADIHRKLNKDTSSIMRCLNKIDVYLIDPYRFGSKSLIGELHTILLEATQ